MWSLPTLGLNLPIYKMSTQTEMRFLLLLSQAEQIDWQLQNPPHQGTPSAPQTSRMALSGQHLSCNLVTVTTRDGAWNQAIQRQPHLNH